MNTNIKKFIKITIILSIILIFILITTFVTGFIKNDVNNANGIVVLQEASFIQTFLVKYHLKYGKYPIADQDTIINNKSLCQNGFSDNPFDCTNKIYEFNSLVNTFIYKTNLDGREYNIEFSINKDNKYLNCIHTSKEKKQGCKLIVGLKGLEVIK